MEGSSSSSNPPTMIFDIFISFRGKDTRNTFVGHLYKALGQLGMMTFKDDKKLLMGDNLSEKLLKAIQESRTSIVVVSKEYASSRWCLKELAKIMDCMAETTYRVLPVFYHVDPSHVRHQSGSFKKSFNRYEKFSQKLTGDQKEKFSKELQNWKDSMTKISNLAGEVVTIDSPEVDIIEKITKQVFEMLCPKLVAPDKFNNLVEMSLRLGKMKMLLDLESNDVRFVGIVGMGGIGKTTIAEVVYDDISFRFWKNSCFLRITPDRNLVSLQHQLLSQLLLEKDIEIWDEDQGAEIIKNRLSGRKVLIVLDGVNNKRQLEKLAGSPNWFGPKSRVIITTRNKDVLRQPNYEGKIQEYNVELLGHESALSLFCKHAFGNDPLDENLKDLCNKIVKQAGRLPLALIRIASYLYDQGVDIWEEELESLTRAHNKRLFDTLKISFDELGNTSQQVFLDLACFFNGKEIDKVIEILRSLGYMPHSEMKLLCDRCLIEVGPENTIFMPNFIQAMGQQIERDTDRERSRIWLHEDVLTVFNERHGLKHIKGIVLDSKEDQEEIELEARLFTNMTCLRILKIGNVQLRRHITNLSKELRLLHWHDYPLECLPSDFESKYLFELLLPIGQTVRLWQGRKRFQKLKVIDASDSMNLCETPDFSEVSNLEKLILRNCTRLQTIDSSVSTLNRLVLLDVRCCFSIQNFSSCYRLYNRASLISGSRVEDKLKVLGVFD